MDTRIALPPSWKGWEITEMIGAGSYGVVYKAERSLGDGSCEQAAIKIIRIPAGEAETAALAYEYPDRNDRIRYCDNLVQGVLAEIRAMELLKANPHVVALEDYYVDHEEDSLSWTVYIRMELLQSLPEYLVTHEPDEAELVKLGTDICSALETCEAHGILHRDIKPENIMTDKAGNFKLGDFGVAKQIGSFAGSLSVRGTFTYMAPEVYHGESYDILADEYSLGVVLYRLFNRNRDPFIDPDAPMVYYKDREEALKRRMRGEKLPAPVSASNKVAQVIAKACAYSKEDRFQTIAEFKKALEECTSKEVAEAPAVEEVAEAPAVEEVAEAPAVKEKPAAEKPPANKKIKPAFILIPILAIIIIVAVIIITGNRGSGEGTVPADNQVKTEAAQETTNVPGTATATEAATEPAALEADAQAVTILPYQTSLQTEYGTKLGPSFLWGQHVYGGKQFSSGMKYIDVDTEEGVRNISAVPYAFLAGPFSTENLILLEFKDQFDVSFVLYGVYEYDSAKKTLHISPTEECIIEQSFFADDPICLQSDLYYTAGLNYGRCQLKNEDSSLSISYISPPEKENKLVINGRLSGTKAYLDITGLDVEHDMKKDAGQTQILFADDGVTKDAVMDTQFLDIGVLNIDYSTVNRPYNGRQEDFVKYSSVRLELINCYPFGFILHDLVNKVDEYYYYQDYGSFENQP